MSQAETFAPSSYQQQVFERIAAGEGNTVIEAVAGSGKTTTIIEALRHTPPGARVVLLAYGAPIAKEMSRRVSPKGMISGRAHVRTMHSLGLAALRRVGECEMDEKKTGRVLAAPGLMDGGDGKRFREMLHLVSLAKATLVDAHDAVAVREMADRYGLMAGPSARFASGGEPLDDLIAILPAVLDECRFDSKHADFYDMIWLPVVNNIVIDEFDWVFVDEAQDLNPAQIQLLLRAAGSGGRVVAIGDRYQSMYGWRGADVDAIPAIIEATNAVTLPLSITYRCPTKHVELAQTIVPHIEARPGAPAGTVSAVNEYKLCSQLRDGDMVICRTNAPLMSYALELIADGVKAVVRGKDIGASLASLARALSVDAPTMAQMRVNLNSTTLSDR